MEGKRNEDGQSRQLPKLSTDLIYSEILPRLPVKSIFRFKAVSHEWCTRLGEPSFIKSYLARSIEDQRVGHFIWVYNESTREHHFLINSGVRDLDSYILKIDDTTSKEIYTEHVKGLILLCCGDGRYIDDVTVINPTTKQIMDIPRRFPNETYFDTYYSLGFDPSIQEFKILSVQIQTTSNPDDIAVCGIFSLGTTNTWRTIDVEFPFDVIHWLCRSDESVCINGIAHWILPRVQDGADIIEGAIARFDFTKDKFSRLDFPSEVVQPVAESTTANDEVQETNKHNRYLIDVGGCLALICFDKVEQHNTMDIWILKDYQKQVWVKNTMKFHVMWREIGAPYPVCSLSKSLLMFTPWRISRNRIVVWLYDMDKKMFSKFKVKLPRFLASDDNQVDYIKTYAANILSIGDQVGHR